MRIAHFIQRYPPALGGSEAYFRRLSEYLVGDGHDVHVFTTNAVSLQSFWSPDGQTLPAGASTENNVAVRRYRIVRWPGRRYLLKALSFIPHRMWQCMTMPCNPIAPSMWRDAGRMGCRFDVVHATAFPYAWPIVCGLRLARRQGVPFFLTPFLHLGDPDDFRDPIRRAYTTPALMSLIHAADGVFVQTPSERDTLIELGIPQEKLILQGLGVDVTDCTGGDRQAARKRWGVRPAEVVVGHLANNSREKGTVDLLQAAATLLREGLPLRIVLAGPEMPNFTEFWTRFAPTVPTDAVIRLGLLDDREKKDFFAGLDVFALPSRSDSFGLVLVEAWANSIPNVAYRAGGVADVVRHQRDGLLARCGDVQELAGCIRRLAGDAKMREAMGEAGRGRIKHEFRWEDRLALVARRYTERLSQYLNAGSAGEVEQRCRFYQS